MKKILALFVAAGLGSATGLSGAEPGFPSPSEKDATPRAGLSGVTFRLFEGDWKTLPDLDGLAPAHSGVLLSNRVDLSPLGAQGGMKCVFDLAPGGIVALDNFAPARVLAGFRRIFATAPASAALYRACCVSPPIQSTPYCVPAAMKIGVCGWPCARM